MAKYGIFRNLPGVGVGELVVESGDRLDNLILELLLVEEVDCQTLVEWLTKRRRRSREQAARRRALRLERRRSRARLVQQFHIAKVVGESDQTSENRCRVVLGLLRLQTQLIRVSMDSNTNTD